MAQTLCGTLVDTAANGHGALALLQAHCVVYLALAAYSHTYPDVFDEKVVGL